MKDEQGLTPKQALFVKEYIKDFNATRAAKAAGYSEKTAYSMGQENLTKPVIKDAVAKYTEKQTKKVDITVENILQSLVDTRAACVKAKQFNNVLKSNELMGKYLAMFTEKHKIEGEVTVNHVSLLEKLKNE